MFHVKHFIKKEFKINICKINNINVQKIIFGKASNLGHTLK